MFSRPMFSSWEQPAPSDDMGDDDISLLKYSLKKPSPNSFLRRILAENPENEEMLKYLKLKKEEL